MSRRSESCLRCCLVLLATFSILAVFGPATYWGLRKSVGRSDSRTLTCSPCICDCPPPLSLLKVAPGLVNLSMTDCEKNDTEARKEMDKHFVDLLQEELKLVEAVTEENSHHMNITLAEARRAAGQYQREAEKCNAATETCEAARERAEALLVKERKITLAWETRARQSGWQGQ